MVSIFFLHNSLNFLLKAQKTAPNGCENVRLGKVCRTRKGGGGFVDFRCKIYTPETHNPFPASFSDNW